MDEKAPRKRQTTTFSRSARNKRILAQLRGGFGYDEIAREEKLSERRIRQIVKQALEGREALESATHAHMQIDRLGQAMRVAGDALARGDVRAVGPFIKAIEKLDRYQSLARQAPPKRRNTSDDDELVMQNLVAQIRSHVLDECRREAEQAVAAAAAARTMVPEEDPVVAPPLAPELSPVTPAPAPQAPAFVAPPLAPELQPAALAPAPEAPADIAPPIAHTHPVSPWGTWAS